MQRKILFSAIAVIGLFSAALPVVLNRLSPSGSSSPVQAADGTLSLSIYNDGQPQPDADTDGGAGTVVAKFGLWAGGEELRLTEVSLFVSDPAAVSSLSLYDGDTLAGGPAVSDEYGYVHFSGVNFVVPGGEPKSLTVRAAFISDDSASSVRTPFEVALLDTVAVGNSELLATGMSAAGVSYCRTGLHRNQAGSCGEAPVNIALWPAGQPSADPQPASAVLNFGHDQYCKDASGPAAFDTGTTDEHGEPICGCITGYRFSGGQCVKDSAYPKCPDLAFRLPNDKCVCEAGFILNEKTDRCEKINTGN